MALKAATKTGSTERVIRTLFQVLVSAIPAVPVLVQTLGLSAQQSIEVVGISGLAVIVIAAIHNGLEAAGLLPAMLKDLPWQAITATVQQTADAQAIAPAVVADAAKAVTVASEVAPVVSAVESAVSQSPANAPASTPAQ